MTADTGTLAIGDVVTISGVNDSAINGRWLVTNVMAKTTNTPASFRPDGSPATETAPPSPPTPAPGPGTRLSSLSRPVRWGLDAPDGQRPAPVHLLDLPAAPSCPPISPALRERCRGTSSPSTARASRGFSGLASTDTPAPSSAVRSPASPIRGQPDRYQFACWDVCQRAQRRGHRNDQQRDRSETGKPATINGPWTVAYNPTVTGFPNAFQLTGNALKGNNDPMSGGSWIDGTDVAVKVIVPNIKSNATLPNGNTPTNPGPTGKIGVRNASGTTYSTADFTVTPTRTPAPPPPPRPPRPRPWCSRARPRRSPGNRSP